MYVYSSIFTKLILDIFSEFNSKHYQLDELLHHAESVSKGLFFVLNDRRSSIIAESYHLTFEMPPCSVILCYSLNYYRSLNIKLIF